MKKITGIILLFVLLLSISTPVLAQGDDDSLDHVLFGKDLSLGEGEIVRGDVVIFGGSLDMATDSVVIGDAIVFGGTQTIQGEIHGDMVGLGGDVYLGPTARVEGDVVVFGGASDVSEEAEVLGKVILATDFNFWQIWDDPSEFQIKEAFDLPSASPRSVGPTIGIGILEGLFKIVKGLLFSVVLAVVGLLVLLFLPVHSKVVGQTVTGAGAASFGVGLLTMLVGLALMVLLLITCLLIPVGLLLGLILVLGTIYGWVVIGYLVGQRLVPAFASDSSELSPGVAALVGVFVVTLVIVGLGALGSMPCLGFFFWLLSAIATLVVASVGLGAVVLSRFGTRVYGGTDAAAPTAVPPSLPGAPEETEPDGPGSGEAPLTEDGSSDVDSATESEEESLDETTVGDDEAPGVDGDPSAESSAPESEEDADAAETGDKAEQA